MSEAREAKLWWAALVASCVMLCVPLLLVDVPPLWDYPNHLARMDVMARLDVTPEFRQAFEIRWGIIPDVAIDTFMPWVVSHVPVYISGRLLLALILLLEVLGVVACAAAIHGGRTWWSLGASLAAYNISFMFGFLNFNLTLGVAMLLAAAWIRSRKRGAVLAAGILGFAATVILFFAHLMGLCFFLVLIASFEASGLWTAWRHSRRRLLSAFLASWPAIAAVAPLAFLYPMTGLSGSAIANKWPTWNEWLTQSMGAFTNYNIYLDGAATFTVVCVVAAAAIRWRLGFAPTAILAVALIGGLYCLLPIGFNGTYFLTTRLAVMFGFLIFIAFRPSLSPRAANIMALVLAAIFTVRMAVIATTWWTYRSDVAQERSLLRHIQPGEFVEQINTFDKDWRYLDGAPAGWRLSNGYLTGDNLIALALIERNAIWPHLFADPGQQPFVFHGSALALKDSADKLPTYTDLVQRRADGDPKGPNPFIAFDKITIGGIWAEPHPETLSPDWLEIIAVNRTTALYKVRRETTP